MYTQRGIGMVRVILVLVAILGFPHQSFGRQCPEGTVWRCWEEETGECLEWRTVCHDDAFGNRVCETECWRWKTKTVCGCVPEGWRNGEELPVTFQVFFEMAPGWEFSSGEESATSRPQKSFHFEPIMGARPDRRLVWHFGLVNFKLEEGLFEEEKNLTIFPFYVGIELGLPIPFIRPHFSAMGGFVAGEGIGMDEGYLLTMGLTLSPSRAGLGPGLCIEATFQGLEVCGKDPDFKAQAPRWGVRIGLISPTL